MLAVYQNFEFDKKLIDKKALNIITKIQKAGFKAYLVGGCVRDLLVGLKPKDFDIVTNAKPKQIHKLFKNSRLIGRRFIIVHILFPKGRFIEVATFRRDINKTYKNGIIASNNYFGTIEQDVLCRDFSINALYYDIESKQVIDYVGGLEDIKIKKINVIGDAKLRFAQDPVRMIRAIRFQIKLKAKLSSKIKSCLYKQSSLLINISPARLYQECIKLFHNEYSLEIYQKLEKYNLLHYLFKQTKTDSFIKKSLINTSLRIKENNTISPVFLFAVFLWNAQNQRFIAIKKHKKSFYLSFEQASEEVIKNQQQQILIQKWMVNKIKKIWFMQTILENKNYKKKDELLKNSMFRISYDFFVLRANSINPELLDLARFWNEMQN
jgi:poly(A) polymerase